MLTDYLRIAWRTLIRSKSFSAINIFGLALGITCSLLIMLWVFDERSVDRFHANGDFYTRYMSVITTMARLMRDMPRRVCWRRS